MAEKGSRVFGDTVPFQKKYSDELKAKMAFKHLTRR